MIRAMRPLGGQRLYLELGELARGCGIAAVRLDNRFRPGHWAMPHDFWWDGRRMWFAVAALAELADELAEAGEHEAAVHVRNLYVFFGTGTTPSANATADEVATSAHSQSTPAAGGVSPLLAAAVASTSQGRAARAENSPRSWLNEWEDCHG